MLQISTLSSAESQSLTTSLDEIAHQGAQLMLSLTTNAWARK